MLLPDDNSTAYPETSPAEIISGIVEQLSGQSYDHRNEHDYFDMFNTTANTDTKGLPKGPPPYPVLFVFVTVAVGALALAVVLFLVDEIVTDFLTASMGLFFWLFSSVRKATPYWSIRIFLIVLMRILQPRIPLPYTCLIMLLGLAYGVLALKVYPPLANYTQISRMDPHWLLQIFLPVLLFESAFTVDIRIFRKSFGHIVILATCGLAVATCLTAVASKYMFGYGWEWLSALMFGALISATDPVAVVALLKDVGAEAELAVVLEGESLLNDGTAIILFNVFLALIQPDFSGESLAIRSVMMVAGGPLFGFLCGRLAALCIANISNDSISEIAITVATAYITFYISEILDISGVLAVVVLGLVMNYDRTVISPEIEPQMHEFWNTLTYVGNTLIFAIVGLSVAEHALMNAAGEDWINLLILYGSIVVIRLISIAVFLPAIRYLQGTKKVYDWRNLLVMSWGGLRGAVSLALAISVDHDERINHSIGSQMLFLTAGIVLLTLSVNGTSTAGLLRVLGMDRVSEKKLAAVDNAMLHVLNERSKEISVLKQDHFLADANWDDISQSTCLRNPYRKRTSSVYTPSGDAPGAYTPAALSVVCGVKTKSSSDEFARVVWLTLLKRSFWEQFEQGMMSRHALRFLTGQVDHVLSHPGKAIEADSITSRWKIGGKLNYCQKLLHKVTGHEAPTHVAGAGDSTTTYKNGRRVADLIVQSCWFKALVYLAIAMHVTAAVVNLALNWHGHHLDEDFFHENIYFVGANAAFCFIYGVEILLHVIAYGVLAYISRLWHKLELMVVVILLIDLCLDVYVLAFGDGGTQIHKTMLRFFDVMSLLRVLRGVRLIKLLFPCMGKMMDSLVTYRLMHGFDIGKAFIIGQKEASKAARGLVENDEALCRLKESADEAQKAVWRDLTVLLAERPDIAKAAKKRYVLRKVLHTMRDDVTDLNCKGLLDDKTTLILRKTLQRKMNRASRVPYRATNPEDLLRQIRWVHNDPILRKYLLGKSCLTKFSKRQRLLNAGQEPCGVVVVVTGIVKPILLQSVNIPLKFFEEEDTLTSGSVIGDYQVLAGKKSSTTYFCQTNVQALVISKDTMEQALVHFPSLRQEMWNVWSTRIALHLLVDQTTCQHHSQEQLEKRIANGHAVIIQNELLKLRPEWELVILVQGRCYGLPQQIPLDGPKVISNRYDALQFLDLTHNPSGTRQTVMFFLEHNQEANSVSSREECSPTESFREHYL